MASRKPPDSTTTLSVAERELRIAAREAVLLAREAELKANAERQLAVDQMRRANEQLVFATLRAQTATAAARRANEAAQADRAALEREAELRERLMNIVGHDLRNPVAAILMSAQHLLKDQRFTGRQFEILAGIEHSAARMRDLIENLIELSRAHRGSLPVNLERTDLRAICRSVIIELELGRSAQGRFQCEFTGDTFGNWDPQRLSQIISNVAGNALDHGATDCPVLLRCKGQGDFVTLEIFNQGVPIPDAQLMVLFELSARRPRSRPRGPGRNLGIGLYIVRELVKSHHGTIDVRSTAQDGTTFVIVLPRNPAAAQ